MKGFGRVLVAAATILGIAAVVPARGADLLDRVRQQQQQQSVRPQPGAPAGGEVQLGFYREEKFIRHMYRGFLGRDPEQDEVAGWRRQVDQGASANDLVAAFLRSDEFFVRQLYLGLLQREAEPGGIRAFTQALRGGKSRAEVVDSLLRSPEFQQRMR